MQQVIGVKFHSNTKIYYFNPKDITFNEGEGVIVETARGLEFGTVANGNHFVKDEEIVKPLKEVIRKATEKDLKQNAENIEKKKKNEMGLFRLFRKNSKTWIANETCRCRLHFW